MVGRKNPSVQPVSKNLLNSKCATNYSGNVQLKINFHIYIALKKDSPSVQVNEFLYSGS